MAATLVPRVYAGAIVEEEHGRRPDAGDPSGAVSAGPVEQHGATSTSYLKKRKQRLRQKGRSSEPPRSPVGRGTPIVVGVETKGGSPCNAESHGDRPPCSPPSLLGSGCSTPLPRMTVSTR